MDGIIISVRNVCTRWRTVSEDEEIWKDWVYSPSENTAEKAIICMLKNVPALRKFRYFGTCNIIEPLYESCKKLTVLKLLRLKLSPALVKLTMERLPELKHLCLKISPTEEGLQITRIIGQSQTLEKLQLLSSGGKTVREGLLKPIADGCPNLISLKCENFNCRNSDICYLMQRKSRQLEEYCHYRPVSADLINAINQCTNLRRLAFADAYLEASCDPIPPIKDLENLKMIEVVRCSFPMLKILPLTVFLDRLPHLTCIGISFSDGNIDDLINKIILKCPILTHLDLEGNNELRCRAFRNISCCKMLKYLDISRCKELRKKAMKYVAEGCPQLQHLDVSNIPIPDSMFRQILRCRNLKTLLMWDCDSTDINPNLISTNLSGLLCLFIGPHFQLGDDVIRDMKQQMPNLTIRNASVLNGFKAYCKIKSECIAQAK
jgi:Leucine-rich repeat (LRR) protein